MTLKAYFLGLVLSLLSTLVIVVPTRAQTPRRNAESEDAFRAPILGKIDKVELLSIESRMGGVDKINATRLIEKDGAQRIAWIWRIQKLRGWSPAACHQPPYAIKFYYKGKLVLFATVCWLCDNIDFIVPDRKHWVRFQAHSRDGQRLKEIFTAAFSNNRPIE